MAIIFHSISVLVALFSFAVTSLTLELGPEPKCYSMFDYEEKLLEKAVKNDIQMKQILEMFENTLNAAETQKKELEDANARLAEMIGNFETTIVSKVLKTLESNNKTKPHAVAFSARCLENYTPGNGETLLYKTIIQNIGGAFNQVSGKFTAPVNGTYLFSVQISTNRNKWGRVKLILNGDEIHSVSKYNDGSSHTTTSGTIVQALAVGDQMWVKQDRYSGDIYVDGTIYGWNQFTGALIYSEN